MLSRNELLKNKKIFSCVQFLKSKGVSKIYLFGSYAKGNANINSDFDFGVIGLDPNLFFSTWYELERISKKHIDLADFDEHPEFLTHLNSYNGAVLIEG